MTGWYATAGLGLAERTRLVFERTTQREIQQILFL
jgi:hypothetical protein